MADHQRDGAENYFPFHQNKEVTGGGSGNRYGGLTPRKKPLISKDHERAFFDSADWALCKQGAGLYNNIALEKLQPKLQRTPRPQLPPRRPVCTSDKGNIVEVIEN
ncbi:uncharacterized protein LOC101208744 [Cucumis sativus]|uniref:Endosulphine n=1 Tax=Cucumis sativus TaxID=3659 RepID=A0A0A0KEZ2_CUCSA|nr:uncharacterized protein LOC101208744 [Cucumis sativus]XP_031742576.1 uncharacterized protein LOC101208744 [Cucumis sativus]KGN47394.1 hypothetical protein Csa_023051 [Cucumis sativus]